MSISIRAIGPGFAAEVTGLDLRRGLSPGDMKAVEAAIDEHAVLVFPNQDITDEQQMAFSLSLGELEDSAGATVTKANLVNDRGIHICKSMLAYERFGHGETPESAGIKGDHLAGKYYVLFDKHYREQIRQLEAEYDAVLARLPRDPLPAEARDVRWLLEELRVSLFAQSLGTAQPVSAKRVRTAVAALAGGSGAGR